MGKKLQRLSLIVGMLLYLFDYGSDIYVAIKYWKNNDVWWFGMTTGFILVPSIIVNITAIIQVIDFWRFIMAVLQLSIVVRYIETIISPYRPVTKWIETRPPDRRRIFFLAMLRYLETITESAPQLCLQVYIMLRQWDFPTYTVVSSVLSLLSLAWSITTLEKERKIKKEGDYKLSAAIVFLIWQLSTLVSRLSAIVIFAYVFRYYVIIFLAAHWLLLAVALLIIQGREYDCGHSLLFACLAAYPSLFHSSEKALPTASPKVEMIVGYIFMMLENIAMVTLSLTIEMEDTPHIDALRPVALSCVIGGSFLSFLFCCCCCCMDFTSVEEHDYGSTANDDITQMERIDEITPYIHGNGMVEDHRYSNATMTDQRGGILRMQKENHHRSRRSIADDDQSIVTVTERYQRTVTRQSRTDNPRSNGAMMQLSSGNDFLEMAFWNPDTQSTSTFDPVPRHAVVFI